MLKKNLILFYILILSTVLIQCQCGDGPTEPPQETTRPTVISTTPINNAADISILDSVIINFSEKIQAQSVSNTTITVANKTSVVTLTDSIAVLTFSTPLSYNTSYTVTISTSIADLVGNNLLNEFSFSFTTEIDPATLPPTISSRYPAPNALIANITDSVTVTFSKNIDPTTINDTTFFNDDGRTGTISYNALQKTAIFQPTIPFAYDSAYTMVISNNVKDSLGNNLTGNVKDSLGNNLTGQFVWAFRTGANPASPQIGIINPTDSIIIGDTVTFFALAVSPVDHLIDSVQFYIDSNLAGVANYNFSAKFLLDASSFVVGSEHTIYAVAYDSAGNSGKSLTRTFFYLWQEVHSEGNDGFDQSVVPNDLRKMFARSTDSTLELRYEYGFDWEFPYAPDTATCFRTYTCNDTLALASCADTAVDLAIYIDTDLNINTGRRDGGGDILNDIGADYRILLGLHGGDTTLSIWNPNNSLWELIYDTTRLINHNIPRNSKTMEIGLLWSDIGNPMSVNIVNVNVFFQNSCPPITFFGDFMPDRELNTHINIKKDNRYIGPQSINNFRQLHDTKALSTKVIQRLPNPFD